MDHDARRREFARHVSEAAIALAAVRMQIATNNLAVSDSQEAIAASRRLLKLSIDDTR